MRIITVCGMGIGTSIILKMNTDQALQDLGIDAETEAADISSARGAAALADLILTSAELADELQGLNVPVEVISNFTDIESIKSAIKAHV